MYNVDFFLDFFGKIPEDQWTVGRYREHNKWCVIGHLSFKDNGRRVFLGAEICLERLFDSTIHTHPININDNNIMDSFDPEVKEICKNNNNPKHRIMKALELIKTRNG